MPDVSPGTALGAFFGGLAAILKIVVEVLKWRAERRLKKAYADSGPSAAAVPAAVPVHPVQLELSAQLKLEAKEVALLRAQYALDQHVVDSAKLRAALESQNREMAALAERLTEQELLNRQLVDEMTRLRTQGGDDVVDRNSVARVRNPDERRAGVRPDARPPLSRRTRESR